MHFRGRNGKRNAAGAGFTLVEILVVVCVIAILIGLTASAAYSARERAYKAAATTEVEQLSAAFKAYRVGDDEEAWPVDTAGAWVPVTKTTLAKLVGGDGRPVLLSIPEERFEPGVDHNGTAVDEAYCDPWGRAYEVKTSRAGGEDGDAGRIEVTETIEVAVSFAAQFGRYYEWEPDVPYVNVDLD